MKWTPLKIVSGMFLLAFCSLFGSSISVFATDDVTGSFSRAESPYFCDNNNQNYPNCSDFTYLSITYTGEPSLPSTSAGPVINNALYGGWGAFNTIYMEINSSVSSIRVTSWQSMNNIPNPQADYTFSYTLHVDPFSASSCPEPEEPEPCPECQVCPAIPENPYDQKLDAIKVAIYVVAGTMLVIYFFYCIYRIIIKAGKK